MIFVVAPCILKILNSLFVQLMHTNCFDLLKLLNTFKTIIVAPTFFDLHKPSSGSYSQYFAKVTMLILIIYVTIEVFGIMTA